MNRKFIAGIAVFLCAVLMLAAILPACAESDASLEADREIIRHADNIEVFHNGVAVFETKNHRSGFFTPEGKILFILEADPDTYIVPTIDGNMLIYRGSASGVMDRYGNILVPVEWEDILICGEPDTWCVQRGNQYQLINSEGEVFGPVSNTWIFFSDGLADVSGNEYNGFITPDGELAFTVPENWFLMPFINGKAEFYYQAEDGNTVYGILDHQGNTSRMISLDSSYSNIVYSHWEDAYYAYREEEDGQLRLVRLDAVTGEITGVSHHVYADTQEEAPLYVYDTGTPAPPVSSGLVPVMIFEASRDGFSYYQSFGYLQSPDLRLAIAPPSKPWSYAGTFSNGVAYVRVCGTDPILGTLDYSLEGPVGVIDTNGNYLISPAFEEIFSLSAGLFRARTNGLYGIVAEDGQFLLEPEYTAIQMVLGSKGDFFQVRKNDLWGVIDSVTLEFILDIRYDDIDAFDPETGCFIVREDGLWSVVDAGGNKIW